MKNGKFETQAEIYQALLDGKKLQNILWGRSDYVSLVNGNVKEDSGASFNITFCDPSAWSIYEESEEREAIELYETWNNYGLKRLCDKNGKYPNFTARRMDTSYYAKMYEANIINKDKPTLKIYADTFEIVRD